MNPNAIPPKFAACAIQGNTSPIRQKTLPTTSIMAPCHAGKGMGQYTVWYGNAQPNAIKSPRTLPEAPKLCLSITNSCPKRCNPIFNIRKTMGTDCSKNLSQRSVAVLAMNELPIHKHKKPLGPNRVTAKGPKLISATMFEKTCHSSKCMKLQVIKVWYRLCRRFHNEHVACLCIVLISHGEEDARVYLANVQQTQHMEMKVQGRKFGSLNRRVHGERLRRLADGGRGPG